MKLPLLVFPYKCQAFSCSLFHKNNMGGHICEIMKIRHGEIRKNKSETM